MRIVVPRRGEKRGLLDLAARNAEVAYQARFNENVAAHYDALETLRAVLALPAVPRRIECFDISTIQGSETVASMVVCEDGRMKKGEYRKFRIRGSGFAGSRARRSAVGSRGDRGSNARPLARSAEASVQPRAVDVAPAGPRTADREPRILDDFASMHEVVLRRYRKLLESGGPFPDLILIDGGKGQLSAAYEALESLGLGQPGGDRHRQEGRAAVHARSRRRRSRCREDSPALLLIQRIRDEAHRFAVTFHRASRTKRDLRSELDDDRRHRAAPAQGAADGVRQRGRRPARDAGRAGAGRRARSPPTRCWRTSRPCVP